jgi:hypothetical protein
MSDAKLKSKAVLGTLALALLVATCAGGRASYAAERPKASSAVKVLVQGGSGVEPVPGAPPPVEASLESRPASATLGPAPPSPASDAARPSLRALSTADEEATIEIDGVREVVRPGSRLGRDTVKAVGTGRLVLQRAAGAAEPASLVIVSFDETGRAKARVFWVTDPTAPAAPEGKRP